MQNMEMFIGDTLSFGVEIGGILEQVDSAYLTVKKDLDSVDYLLQKSIGDGIWFDSIGTYGVRYGVRIAPADTADAEAGNYYYDLQISLNGDVFTILDGVLTLKQGATTV